MSKTYSNSAFLFGISWAFATGVALGLIIGLLVL